MSHEIRIDPSESRDITVEDRWMKPTPEYPDGSWLHTIDGKVQVATGYYATLYPDKPSLYWHGKPPFVMIDTADWEWEKMRKGEDNGTAHTD